MPALRDAGIERERRIALVMLDTVDFPIAFWGAIRAGVVPVPINTLLPPEMVGYILEDSRAAALFVSAPLLEPLLPVLRSVAELRPGHRGAAGWRHARADRRCAAVGFAEFLAGGDPATRDRGRLLAGRGRVLALFVGLDRRAERRAARARAACARPPTPMARRCSASRRTT